MILTLAAFCSILIANPAQLVHADVSNSPKLLSDPFLQNPTANTVNVVWFTAFEGTTNKVLYGKSFEKQAVAVTTKMSRMRQDTSTGPIVSNVWRHDAIVTGLPANTDGKEKLPYKVVSDTVTSNQYTLQAMPGPGVPMKILLTSDSQLHTMVAADMQKVKETVGNVDAVFFAGDCVNAADSEHQWFDDPSGISFFPVMQGTASNTVNGVTYHGADIIQNAPIYTAIGNHEVMGKYNTTQSVGAQCGNVAPVSYAEQYYDQMKATVNPTNDPQIKAQFIKDNSFNTTNYEQVFDLPKNNKGNEDYYAVTVGNVRLITLDIARAWRTNTVGQNGKYSEATNSLNNPNSWGFGSFIFEPIKKGSDQYNWLKDELQSPAYKQAKYKVVMFHFPPHELGDNMVPAFTDPVQKKITDANGHVTQILYDYPLDQDYLKKDLEPLLESAGVDMVFYGHSHLWNRFQSAGGINYLESSNVGNTYGASYNEGNAVTDNGLNLNSAATTLSGMIPANTARTDDLPTDMTYFNPKNFVTYGDPNGLLPIMPNLVNINNVPYLASNTTTEFSILDTGTEKVDSYYYDTNLPNSPVVKFDSFSVSNTKFKSGSGTASTTVSTTNNNTNSTKSSGAKSSGTSVSNTVSNPDTGASGQSIPLTLLVILPLAGVIFAIIKVRTRKAQ